MKILKEKLPEADILLFHSRFVAPDRASREEMLLKRIGKHSKPEDRRGLVVIGTQVLEQSLDIDFDLMITQLCPMDLLLQRLGRLHRHERNRPQPLQEAKCYLLETDEGSVKVYGKWLLLRTDDLLPDVLKLPGDISELVQETYRKPEPESLDGKHQEAWDEFQGALKSKEDRAHNYRLNKPSGKLHGLLQTECPVDGSHGEAAVRDSEPSITVLIMQKRDGKVTFLPWQYEGAAIEDTQVPNDEDGRKIAQQRLNLPLCFSNSWNNSKTIYELENLNREKLAQWQHSSWIRDELVMLIDEDFQIELCGQHLKYDRDYGLINLDQFETGVK